MNINGTNDTVTLVNAVQRPRANKQLNASIIQRMYSDASGAFSVFNGKLFAKASLNALFVVLFFTRLIDTVVECDAFSDDESATQMRSVQHMGIAFVTYISSIYEEYFRNEPNTKCLYVLTKDLKKYVFVEGYTVREQFRFYLAAIIYGGQGEIDEPARKKRAAMSYKNDLDPNKVCQIEPGSKTVCLQRVAFVVDVIH